MKFIAFPLVGAVTQELQLDRGHKIGEIFAAGGGLDLDVDTLAVRGEAQDVKVAARLVGVNPGNSGEVHLIDNVFFDCWDIGQLVNYEYFDDDKAAAEFRSNTYVADVGARAADINHDYATDDGIQRYNRWLLTDKNLQEKLAEYLGDTEAKVIPKRLIFVSPE